LNVAQGQRRDPARLRPLQLNHRNFCEPAIPERNVTSPDRCTGISRLSPAKRPNIFRFSCKLMIRAVREIRHYLCIFPNGAMLTIQYSEKANWVHFLNGLKKYRSPFCYAGINHSHKTRQCTSHSRSRKKHSRSEGRDISPGRPVISKKQHEQRFFQTRNHRPLKLRRCH
jgi:hypothetical protein